MTRKKLMAANWKMHKTPEQAREFVASFLPLISGYPRDEIVLCPPFVCIPATIDALQGSSVETGAQDVCWEPHGAFTGEVSPAMLRAAGCTHVIIGHSERRQFFGETDDTVNRKLRAVLPTGLKPIVCVGEVLEEREAGITEDVLRRQCSLAFREISAGGAAPIIVAYEPVWAIGTGKTATPELAGETHRLIRHQAAQAFGEDVANRMRILYGGSVKPENAALLMSHQDIDGALVGGASLEPKSFAAIVNY